MNGFRTLQDQIQKIRSALVRHALVESLLLIAICALCIALTMILVALTTDALVQVRTLGGLTLIAAASTAIWIRYGRMRQWTQKKENIALLMESRLGHTDNELITALEWGHLEEESIESQGLSSTLVRELLDRAEHLVTGKDVHQFVDREAAAKSMRFLLLLLLATAMSAAWTPSVYEAGVSRLVWGAPVSTDTEGADQITEVDVLLENISLTLIHPAYSRIPARTLNGSSGDIAALPGTSVTLRARPLHGIHECSLHVDEGSPIPLRIGKDGYAEGTWILSQSSLYRVQGTQPSGHRFQERGDRSMDLLPDHEPVIRLMSPEEDMEVKREDQVQLIYQASDDFGLSQVDVVVRNMRGGDPQEVLALRLDAERLYRGTTLLDVRDVNPEPGDTLEVFLVAFDQDTISGPKAGRSNSLRLKIWSPKEKHDELVDQTAELVEGMLALLADRLENPLELKRKDSWDSGLGTASVCHQKTQEFLDSMEKLIEDMRQDALMPIQVVDDLKAMRVRHQDQLVAEGHILRTIQLRKRKLEAENARLLVVQNEEQIALLEVDILHLEDLVDRLRKDKLLDQTRDLLSQQDELMRLLDEMKNDPNADNTERAEAMVDQLQNQLSSMMKELAKQTKKLPHENFNPGALDPKGTQADVRDFQSELNEIRRLLAEGDIEGARKAAEELQKRIAEMMASMEEGFDGLRMGGASGEMQEKLQEVDAEVGQVAKEERRIFRETSEVNENVRKAMEEMRQERLDPFFQVQKERVAQIRKELREIREDSLELRDQEKLNRLKDSARDLEDRLGQEDLDRSDEFAENIARECKGLGNNMSEFGERSESRREARQLQEGSKRADAASELAQEIARDIKELIPDPKNFLSEGDEKKLNALEKAQGKNQSRLKKLRAKLSEMGEVSPALEGAFSELLKEAGKSMGEAKSQLGEGRPRTAAQSEENAMDRLGRAQKRLQQMMQPGQGPGSRKTGLSDQDAGIPDPEDYTVPADFRNEVMRAMKGNAPSTFQGQIESYYRELMR